jgi:hypothetical protein
MEIPFIEWLTEPVVVGLACIAIVIILLVLVLTRAPGRAHA